jgi:hypothetical protein
MATIGRTAPNGKTYYLRTATVGQNYGTQGMAMHRNGKVAHYTEVVGYGNTGRAIELVEQWIAAQVAK